MSSDLEREMQRQRHERGSHSTHKTSRFATLTSMVHPVLKGIELFSPLTSMLGGTSVKVFNVASGILEKLI